MTLKIENGDLRLQTTESGFNSPIYVKPQKKKFNYSKNVDKSLGSRKFLKIIIDEINLILEKISHLNIFVTDEKNITVFLIKNYRDIDSLFEILSNARKIFGNRELILTKNEDLENTLNLIVRQESYSEDEIDLLDDLIYESIIYNSEVFISKQMKSCIIPNTDYKTIKYSNDRVRTI